MILISIGAGVAVPKLSAKQFMKLSRADQEKYLEAYPRSSHKYLNSNPPAVVNIADTLGVSEKDISTCLKEPKVNRLLAATGKGFSNLFNTIDNVLKLPNRGLRKGFETLHKTKAFQALQKGTIKVDKFLEKHPVIKKAGGPLVAGALAYQWLNMSFSGDFDDDFNIDALVDALSGSYSIEQLLGTPDGLKACTQLIAGLATGGLLSFPWHGKMNIAFAAAYTGARRLGKTKLGKKMHTKWKSLTQKPQKRVLEARADSSLSASPILMHITRTDIANKILETNKFYLTTGEGTTAEKDLAKKAYYLSLTRSNTGRYSVTGANSDKVIFTLDGTRLSQRYKVVPIDYWGEDFRKAAGGDYEAEDRLFHDKATINGALKYIRSARVMIDPRKSRKRLGMMDKMAGLTEEDMPMEENRISDQHIRRIRRFLILCKRNKIPVRLYDNKKHFLFDNRAKQISPREYGLKTVEKPNKPYTRMDRSYLSPYIELWLKPSGAKLSKEAQKQIVRIKNDMFDEATTSFKNEIHNARSVRGGKTERQLNTLISLMRKEGIDAKQFIDRLREKYPRGSY